MQKIPPEANPGGFIYPPEYLEALPRVVYY